MQDVKKREIGDEGEEYMGTLHTLCSVFFCKPKTAPPQKKIVY